MKCERRVEKINETVCEGSYCEPDGFDAARIAQNFSPTELEERLNKMKEDLLEKPESCELQYALNQLNSALKAKGVFN